MRRGLLGLLVVGICLAGGLTPGPGGGATARASAAPGASAAVDEDAPPPPPPDTGVHGPRILYATKPALERETRACATRAPVCVHAGAATAKATSLAVLAAAERAWATLTGALGLPAPDVDDADLAYHIFLVPSLVPSLVPGAGDRGSTHLEARDVRSRLDRARTFGVIDASMRAGCMLEATVARVLARASLFRVAPATAEGVARAQTTYLAELVVPCSLAFSADAVARFQSMPERAICDARVAEDGRGPDDAELAASPHASERFTEGAALFWRRIDWAYGARPGAMVMASWALSGTRTDVGAERWHDEPDAFDVLRESFKGTLFTGSTVHDLVLDSAVARAFAGSADDGIHIPETRTLGDAARVTLDWDLPWPSRPRRLAPRAPVAPTGASYVVIRHAGAPPGARLRVELEWEEHALFRWAFVKLDQAGRELGRVPIPTRDRAKETQMTLVDLDGVDRVLLVGANVGDPAYRFDPDDEVWEPHGWLMTIAAE